MSEFNKTPYQYFPVANLPSGEEFKVSAVGSFVTLLSYTGTSDDVYISIGGESFQILPKGISIKLSSGQDFTNLRFKQLSGAPQSLAVALTTGEVYDSRLILTATSLDVNIASNSLESPVPVTVTSTIGIAVAADSTGREVILQNNGSNDIWLGDANIDPATSRGYKLEVGTQVVWSCADNIRAKCAAGLNSTLSITKLKKV